MKPAGAPLRVCLSIFGFPPRFAGHGIQMQRTLPFLAEQGVETTVLTLPAAGAPTREEVPGGRVERLLPEGTGHADTLRRALSVRRYWADARERFDVCHIATHWDFAVNIRYLQRQGVAVVGESVLVGEDDPSTIASRRGGARRLRWLAGLDAWLVISRTFAPHFEQAGLSSGLDRLVYVGVDTDRYQPVSAARRSELRSELGLPTGGRTVISIGSMTRRKGMDRVLAAWAALRPDPQRDRLLLLGPHRVEDGLAPGEADFSRSLQECSRAPELAGTVVFVGRSDRVEDYLAVSDLFLFLSRSEGFGTVTAEAMAMGVPVLVSPLDGIGDELTDEGRCGCVARSPDEPEAVAASARELLATPPPYLDAARRRVVELFSLRTRGRRLAEIYREVAQRRKLRAERG